MFPQTLTRLQYFIRWICFVAGFAILVGLTAALIIPLEPNLGFDPFLFVILPMIFVGLVFKIVALDIPRMHSIGWSPWLLLLMLIPMANTIMQILLFAMPPKATDEAPPLLVK